MADQENHDVFSDETEETAETEETSQEETEETETDAEEAEDEGAETEETEQQGDDDAETPAANEDEGEKPSGKMIPEHRFKAALKDVTDKLTAAETELAERRAKEAPAAPDHKTDPEGYERHMRIQSSKEIVSDMFPDYDEKIEHFQAMAKENPHLNVIVGNAKNPAKMAYDLAKEHLEISELREISTSGELKEFRAWKKSQAAAGAKAPKEAEKAKPRALDLASRVPNLNRNAPSLAKAKSNTSEDDDLFAGHHNAG